MVDKLFPGQDLIRNDRLVSENGKYRLVFQEDGNLVLYNNQDDAMWNSGTSNQGGQIAKLQEDGNFVIYAEGGRLLWNTDTDGLSISNLLLQNDGNLVLYGSNGEDHLWQTRTYGWGQKIFDKTVPLPDPPGATARVKVYERRVLVQLAWLGIPFDEHSVTQDGPNAFHYSHRNPITKEKHKFFFAVQFDKKQLDFVYTLKIAGEEVAEKKKNGLVEW